ncbi:MAG: amidase family protein, partial [Erythrobacter sp.]
MALAFEAVLAALPRAPAPVRLAHPNRRIRYAGFIKVSRYLADALAGVAVSPQLAKLLDYGPRRAAPDWAEDQTVLANTAAEVQQIVAEHGWLIAPTVPNPPFPHSQAEPVAQADFTCLANIAGLPALSLPMGWTGDGLPLGVQIIGCKGNDAGL